MSRLLEAGNATVCKKKISFQDSSNLPKDLTHVFVEAKLRPDVLHLESKGISVHSPDYIPEHIIKVHGVSEISNGGENAST